MNFPFKGKAINHEYFQLADIKRISKNVHLR